MRLLQSLTRGLEAMNYLVEAKEPVRLTDLAGSLGIDKSNAAHLLKTLVAAGYATQDDSRRYAASSKLLVPERSEHTLEEIVAVKEQWHSSLERLVSQTSECAHLAVLVGNRVWYIDKVDSPLQLKVDHPIGTLSPLHCTALGKAFLAFGKPALPENLPSYTPRTLTSHTALAAELERTRKRGYAIDDEEFAPGIRCVAGSVRDEAGQMIAAIGISGPSVRVDGVKLEQLGHTVSVAAAGAYLGKSPP